MSFQFNHSIYLWGFLLIFAVWFSCRRSLVDAAAAQKRVVTLIRVLTAALIIPAVAGLSITSASKINEVLFVIDESASIDKSGKENVDQYINKVQNAAASAEGRSQADRKSGKTWGELGKYLFKKIYFSEMPRFVSINSLESPNGGGTNIERAIRTAAASADPDRQSRILLFSDGNETRGDALAAATASSIPVFTLPLEVSTEPETQLFGLKYPESVRRGETFRVVAQIRSNRQGEGKISLFQNGCRLETKTVTIEKGENRYPFDVVAKEAKIELLASVETKSDAFLDNNSCRAVIETEGEPTILLIDQNPETVRDFVHAMKEQKINIEVRSSEGIPAELGDFEKYDSVILSDLPAEEIPRERMEVLNEYVRTLGGGLIVLGGENAFGLGGSKKTLLAEMMPVRAVFENEEEKPGVALCLAVDRSGSMEGEKMNLTQDAVRAVIELLKPRDELSLIAFDMIAHKIIPLQKVAAPSVLIQTVGSITSEGGTNIYAALDEAWREMTKSEAKYKHIILLTDGKSESADYESVIQRIEGAKITLSTVGIGDCDRDLLENLARDGNGRYYECEDARTVPQIFIRETSNAQRSSLSEMPTLPVPVSVYPILDKIELSSAPPLLGNVVTTAKPSSEVHLTTETGDPLLVSWRYGLGFSIAFTSDIKGRWSAEWLDWPEYTRLWAQILRSSLKKSEMSNVTLSLQTFEDGVNVAVNAKNSSGEFINNAEVTMTLLESTKSVREAKLEQTAPGRYKCSVSSLTPGRYTARTVLSLDGETISTNVRGFVVEQNREKDVKAVNETMLRQISTVSNGIYNPSPEQVLSGGNADAARRVFPCWPWLLTAALFMFTLEILLRRFDLFRRT